MFVEDNARMGSTQELNKRALAGLDWLASQILITQFERCSRPISQRQSIFEAGGQIEAPIQISQLHGNRGDYNLRALYGGYDRGKIGTFARYRHIAP
jgi:hypothetical protein